MYVGLAKFLPSSPCPFADVNVVLFDQLMVDGPTTGFKTCFAVRSSEKLVVKARGEKGSEAC